jgi:site-specific recombinase XerC
MAVIASIYQYWFDTGYLTANPASGLVSGTQVRTGFAPSRFLPAAVLSVCDEAKTNEASAVDVELVRQRRQAIWALFRYTGVRLAELAWDSKTNLPRIGSDETERGALYVQGKGGKLRAIPPSGGYSPD